MMRRRRGFAIRIAAVTAWTVLVAGCASGGPEPAAPSGPAEAAAGTPGEPPPPTLLRSPGTSRYRLTIDSDEGRGPQTVVAVFDLETRGDGSEHVTLLSVARGRQGTAPAPLVPGPEVRLAFGGDPEQGGVLGRFRVPADGTIDGLVPASVAEPVFGAVTDLLSFVFVQSQGFGADRLRSAGDSHRFEPFAESWSRPPHLLEARIACPGGVLALEEVGPDAAVLRWSPEPMRLTMLRRAASREPDGDGARILLSGTETLALEIRCDPRNGALLSGRSLRDDLDLRLWMGYPEASVPAEDALPSTGGASVSFRRALTLERVSRDLDPAGPDPADR